MKNADVKLKQVVKGQIFWSRMFKPDEMSGKYQFDLGCLSDAAIAKLSAAGANIKTKGDERKEFITCKSNYPVRTVDDGGMAWDEDVLIGNGTLCKVALKVIHYENSFGPQVANQADKVQIDSLVSYTADGEEVDLNEAEAL